VLRREGGDRAQDTPGGVDRDCRGWRDLMVRTWARWNAARCATTETRKRRYYAKKDLKEESQQ